MKTTFVFAHPWHGSFNKAILDTAVKKLEEQGKEYQIIDLHKDNFDPVLREEDLALYSKGETTDPQVKEYQEILKNTDELVFIFPIWWYDLPAMLKGFIDKVFLKDFSYIETKTGLKGLLTHIKKARVITTSESPSWYLVVFGGNVIKKAFIKATLKGVGIKDVQWINSSYTTSGSNDKRTAFLKKIHKIF
ncbi:NAD(P)H-dependent oxidoreductase [Flammeovirga sp. EKP202]|uniref:NAD(P)H-dependent oxidoreductase n=1 Tax=Flammeovirga sp. EKP202 TaxID=2770592 RepID=UPI00165F5CC1|nr:NAD(P)H-dependent oxidoreductase [Flammeovirga sp. EKP202]MBD0403808.1 NAD(P)H-dependent oxidoreductase [Flammeovirga sp. EKP202]